MKDPHFWAFFALLAIGYVIWCWQGTIERPLPRPVPGGDDSSIPVWN